MPDQDPRPVLHVPARDIPIPTGLSPEAQAQLARGTLSNPPWPSQGDIPAWRALIARMDEMGLAGLTMIGQHIEVDVEEIDADGVRVFVVTPRGLPADEGSVYLDIHGGALLWGGGPSCRAMGIITAGMVRARVWAVDYRMPPDHPYPAGLADCVTAYRALLRERPPEKIIIGGASAGGNLAPATILKARDEGLPLPAAAVLMTPELDLSESGDTFNTLLGVDTALSSRLMPANLLYAAGHDLTDPYVSPLFGDFTKGFPPTFLQSGTRDLFLSNTVRMHRALRQAGVEAELHVFEAATHVMFMGGPESQDRSRELRRFVDEYWRRGVDDAKGGVFVPARRIPAPPTVSPEAHALLANPPAFGSSSPAPKDKAAWRTAIAEGSHWLTARMAENAKPYPAEILTHQLSETPLYEVVPESLSSGHASSAIFYVHGGAFIHGAGLAGAYISQPLASLAGLRAFCVDYRMPPDHPFPTGMEDAVEAYRWVLQRHKPENIVVAGGSAGGGLAATLVLKARDLGLPMPGACILATPEADLTESGDSFETNDTVDVVAQHRLTESIALYADGHDLRDPYLSPIFGDFTKGFPPTILTTGTRDLFLSNTVLMHRALLRAGVEAELHVWEAMPHGGFFGAPEDKEILQQQVRFIYKRLGLP